MNKGPRSVASSFTGADGIMLKVGQMDAFTTYTPLLNNEPVMPALDADVDYNIAEDNIDNNTSVVNVDDNVSAAQPPPTSTVSVGEEIQMPNIQIMVCTSAADCGVSAKQYLTCGKQKGITATMYSVLQNMGRVDRLNNAGPGECTYEVHISFDSVVSLYVRIMRNTDIQESKRQVD